MHKILTTDKEELRILEKELMAILKTIPIAGTVDKAIKQVQLAIIGAIIASTIISR